MIFLILKLLVCDLVEVKKSEDINGAGHEKDKITKGKISQEMKRPSTDLKSVKRYNPQSHEILCQ